MDTRHAVGGVIGDGFGALRDCVEDSDVRLRLHGCVGNAEWLGENDAAALREFATVMLGRVVRDFLPTKLIQA